MKTPYTQTWNPLTDPHAPLDWPTPELVEVADVFDGGMACKAIDKALATMALTPTHMFQIATTRPDRMAEYFTGQTVGHRIYQQVGRWLDHEDGDPLGEGAAWDRAHKLAEWRAEGGAYAQWKLPLHNVVPAAKVCTQAEADERIPLLLRCPAVLRAVVLRLRERVELFSQQCPNCQHAMLWRHDLVPQVHNGQWNCTDCTRTDPGNGIDWCIIETCLHPDTGILQTDALRGVLRQCSDASVPAWYAGALDGQTIHELPEALAAWTGVA